MEQSCRGQFLVSTPQLRDQNFFQTAVLMLEHSSEGAMGLVVNRPSSINVAHALAKHFELPNSDDVIYVGGPVEPTALCVVHGDPTTAEDQPSVVPGIYLAQNAEVFDDVIRGSMSGEREIPFRIYSGYAGWGARQLDREIARGDWLTIPASATILFSADPYSIWDRLIRTLNSRREFWRTPAEKAGLN